MKTMNHANYITKTTNMTESQLKFTIKDCREALDANPYTVNWSYYADEICYCGMELKRRTDKLKKILGV